MHRKTENILTVTLLLLILAMQSESQNVQRKRLLLTLPFPSFKKGPGAEKILIAGIKLI